MQVRVDPRSEGRVQKVDWMKITEFWEPYINIWAKEGKDKTNHSMQLLGIPPFKFASIEHCIPCQENLSPSRATYAVTLDKTRNFSCFNFLICKEELNNTICLKEILCSINEEVCKNMLVMVWEGRFIILNKFLALMTDTPLQKPNAFPII